MWRRGEEDCGLSPALASRSASTLSWTCWSKLMRIDFVYVTSCLFFDLQWYNGSIPVVSVNPMSFAYRRDSYHDRLDAIILLRLISTVAASKTSHACVADRCTMYCSCCINTQLIPRVHNIHTAMHAARRMRPIAAS